MRGEGEGERKGVWIWEGLVWGMRGWNVGEVGFKLSGCGLGG